MCHDNSLVWHSLFLLSLPQMAFFTWKLFTLISAVPVNTIGSLLLARCTYNTSQC
jgi:hypothetical protein